ncbi:MAG: FmdB family zinc ribbon protein [Thermodesulfobacteriota bacterium]
MPIYEYQCSQCDEIFEIFQKINESSQPACPKCSGPAKRLISATNFVLKGPGFYVNDYPSRSRKEGEKSEKQETDKEKTSKAEDKKAA